MAHSCGHQIEIRRERRHLEQMEASARRAKHMESLGVLAGGVAHDFNNMLAIITGFADLAIEEVEPESGVCEYLEQLLVATTRAAEMVEHILSFSRRAETERSVVSLGRLLEETIKLLRSMLPSSVVIRHELAPETPMVLADTTQIQQVIMNLCANAKQAMPEGGELFLQLMPYKVSKVECSAYPHATAGDHAVLVVRDTGTGMPADILDRIFEPFFTTKEFGKGTGMGLATCHGIVTSHGGFMTVESEVGVGSVFRIFLPSSAVVAGEMAAPQRQIVNGGSERILVIDDEQMLREMASATLRNLGYHVVSFSSSIEAVEAFEQSPEDWDVVITDQTMPRLDGVGVLRRVRRLRSDLPVVIMTGYSDKLTADDDGGVGASAIIRKPFRRPELAATLRRILDRQPANT